jgi:hypothetical protein
MADHRLSHFSATNKPHFHHDTCSLSLESSPEQAAEGLDRLKDG